MTTNRVFVEDARRDGSFLRATWHPEARQLVVSQWEGTVCKAAVRVPVEGVPDLVALCAGALADAMAPSGAEVATSRRSRSEPWQRRFRSLLRRRRPGDAPTIAELIPWRTPSEGTPDRRRGRAPSTGPCEGEAGKVARARPAERSGESS